MTQLEFLNSIRPGNDSKNVIIIDLKLLFRNIRNPLIKMFAKIRRDVFTYIHISLLNLLTHAINHGVCGFPGI